MKYAEILPDVLAGNYVKIESREPWIRMDNNGRFYIKGGMIANITLDMYKLNTWEVKPEEIHVLGMSKLSGERNDYTSYVTVDINHNDQRVEYPVCGMKAYFPTDKPQKYKLVPITEDEE